MLYTLCSVGLLIGQQCRRIEVADPLVTTIGFDELEIAILVDRRERTAFLMDWEANHLGGFKVVGGKLLWFGSDDTVPPDAIVETVNSMIGRL